MCVCMRTHVSIVVRVHVHAWVCVRMCDCVPMCAHASVCVCTVQILYISFGVSMVVAAAVYTDV